MPSIDFWPPGPVASAFMSDGSFVRGIRGPVGSGKSVTCCVELMRAAMGQEPWKGLRRTRFAVIRNTNPELRTTTIKTWRDWFGDDWGRFKWSAPYTHEIRFQLPDRTMVESEVIFLALDKAADVKKLLSMELTAAFVNEAREVPKDVVDAVTMRVGRFPSEKEGGVTRKFVIMDTNSPDDDHWWAIMSGEVEPPEYMTEEERTLLVRPSNWRFFTQPPAMFETLGERGKLLGYRINPERENAFREVRMPDGSVVGVGLRADYYENMVIGKTRAWANVYVLNKYAALVEGRPVYPTFRRDAHVAAQRLVVNKAQPVIVGVDFGRTPAAAFLQQVPGGGWRLIHELMAKNMGAKRFANLFKQEIARLGWSDCQFEIFGDPSGDDMVQSDETSPMMMMRNAGVPVREAATNDPSVRIEAVEQLLDRLIDGVPALLVSPHCVVAIAGFEGAYHYRRKATSGEHYEPKPDKNRHSHVHDAIQYGVSSKGEAIRILRPLDPGHAMVAQRGMGPLGRQGAMAAARRGGFRSGFR